MGWCFHCWARIDRDTVFCPRCGLHLAYSTAVAVSVTVVLIFLVTPMLLESLSLNEEPGWIAQFAMSTVVALAVGLCVGFPMVWLIANLFWRFSIGSPRRS